jgi:hypothetical protein
MGGKRKIEAILVADIVGYRRLAIDAHHGCNMTFPFASTRWRPRGEA